MKIFIIFHIIVVALLFYHLCFLFDLNLFTTNMSTPVSALRTRQTSSRRPCRVSRHLKRKRTGQTEPTSKRRLTFSEEDSDVIFVKEVPAAVQATEVQTTEVREDGTTWLTTFAVRRGITTITIDERPGPVDIRGERAADIVEANAKPFWKIKCNKAA